MKLPLQFHDYHICVFVLFAKSRSSLEPYLPFSNDNQMCPRLPSAWNYGPDLAMNMNSAYIYIAYCSPLWNSALPRCVHRGRVRSVKPKHANIDKMHPNISLDIQHMKGWKAATISCTKQQMSVSIELITDRKSVTMIMKLDEIL